MSTDQKASPPKTEDETTAEIITTLEAIIVGTKKDNEALRSDIDNLRSIMLQPTDVSKIVEAHTAATVDDINDLKGHVASLKLKSQQRLSMDPAFLDEIKKMTQGLINAQRNALMPVPSMIQQPALSGQFSSAQQVKLQKEFKKYTETQEPTVEGNESRLLPAPIPGLSISTDISRVAVPSDNGVASLAGKPNHFVATQQVHVQHHMTAHQNAVLAQYLATPARVAEVKCNMAKAKLETDTAGKKQKLQDEITALNQNPSLVNNIQIEQKKYAMLVAEAQRIAQLSNMTPDHQAKIGFEKQNAVLQEQLSAQSSHINRAKLALHQANAPIITNDPTNPKSVAQIKLDEAKVTQYNENHARAEAQQHRIAMLAAARSDKQAQDNANANTTIDPAISTADALISGPVAPHSVLGATGPLQRLVNHS